jgi:hypothetical protein
LIGGNLLGRFEWEDAHNELKGFLVEDQDRGGLVALSPGKWDDYCRRRKPLFPRSRKILEHFGLPEGRFGWEILMDRLFNARLTQRETSGPGELAEWEETRSVWIKNHFYKGDWSDEFTGPKFDGFKDNPIGDFVEDSLHGWD